jgi:hypothetical protein
LVTFDHLSKCPRCENSFDLSRRLTRRRSNPNRRIVLPAAGSEQARRSAASDAASPTPETVTEATASPASALPEAEASAPPVTADPDLDLAPPAAAPPAFEADAAEPPEPEPTPETEPAPDPAVVPTLKLASIVPTVRDEAPATPDPASAPPAAAALDPAPAPEPTPAPVPEAIAPVSGTAPTLTDLAESEQRGDLAVNVAAAVTAVRDAVRTPAAGAEDATAAEPDPRESAAPGSGGKTDSQTIKERMMRASRARRKERPDLVTESIDPALPDWYEPDLDEPSGAPRSKGKSAGRR